MTTAPPWADGLARRIAESALAWESGPAEVDAFRAWFAERARTSAALVRRVPLDSLTGWQNGADVIRHASGRFFTIEGLDIHVRDRPVPHWRQPIINQPEIGILGILVKEFDGVMHCLMQAKVEPGNSNGLQLSPTVQATRSNYTRVHGGRQVPYLDYFRDLSGSRVIADVRQSEQGSAFYQKRNRNMIVETTDDVEVLDGFRWMTLGQMHRVLALDDLVNMDARTVMSCLPFATSDPAGREEGDGFRAALLRSCDGTSPALHRLGEILSWVTDARTRIDVSTSLIPLREVSGWRRTEERISHETGLFFSVIGVDVEATGREVAHWTQPMIEPHGTGLVAFLCRRIDGVLHVLVQAQVEAGYVDVIELAPTVQCTPDNYSCLPADARPPFLDEVLLARPEQIRFTAVLSEEGGRFFHARNRYTIIEVEPDADLAHPNYRWVTMAQLADLLRHSHYLNVQARSLVACLHSLTSARD
ncbi:oxidase EvaA [Thermocatellispora tengchongensis]|uniref:Oxidase EvaA n=1 Tax=Thermocatellispora tengchongensis TaxID=1073253 RepID=A0A840PHY5_9ACTN|nr:NDP-hexose 2,3-dehydratase family protein [Thermocatellispora tengchongensis]MBB5137513.1 oxidase EvaA [Thermocatellispora tengchongensis]